MIFRKTEHVMFKGRNEKYRILVGKLGKKRLLGRLDILKASWTNKM
jgi:hypothetical protein